MISPALPALAVDGLGLQIGGARILQDVGFTINAGEMIGVIGPNGAGKTTLFNLISGVMRPTAGSIRLNGREITAAPIHQRAKAGWDEPSRPPTCFPG
ncbi:probable ABC transporter ATP-binding protein AZC_3926 [Arthrobacter sp. Hiyo6]|nr:probable ABC transporter ATP-binding protein AZC_3926 [Arthrobacter sp. Hiyo6]